MRYENWDILLFPVGGETKVPMKEFKVACHVVRDTEFSHAQRSSGIPTLCCFVPSLPAGVPFQVSIHSWSPPTVSKITESYTSFPDNVVFTARLFVDGRHMSSTAFTQGSGWPHVLAHSFVFSKGGDLEPLKFPIFRQEVLQQDHWSPADDLGRIKVVISEGFPRDSFSMPIERVKNVVAFSFQHAPLDILESSGIAWPNQSMWQSIPLGNPRSVPPAILDNSESHAHSPRRRPKPNNPDLYPMPIFQGMQSGDNLMGSSGRPQASSGASQADFFLNLNNEPQADVDFYFDWLGGMANGSSDIQPENPTYGAGARKGRKSSTDTSMPDYVSLGGHRPNTSGNTFGSVPIHEDDDASMASMGTIHAPMNTPASGQSISFGSGNTMFPPFPQSGKIPTELAETLTASLLNQPAPMKEALHKATHTPANEVKSRKENRSQMEDVVSSSNRGSSFQRPECESVHLESRRVLTGASAKDLDSSGFFETKKGLENTARNSSTSRFNPGVSGDREPEDALRAISGNSEKISKRARNFTPASSKAIDEADEPSRGSPRLRLSWSHEPSNTKSG